MPDTGANNGTTRTRIQSHDRTYLGVEESQPLSQESVNLRRCRIGAPTRLRTGCRPASV